MKEKAKDTNKEQKDQQEKTNQQGNEQEQEKHQQNQEQTTSESKEQDEKQEEQNKSKDTQTEQEKEKTDKEKLSELHDKYLRLTAEYDNYRKRTLKEKMELSKTAGEDVISSLLPVMDDFERALQSIDESQDIDAVKEGIHLIYNKLREALTQKGLKEIEAQEQEFDTDKHEAVSKIPAPSEDMKGKVVDVIQKGYYLNDKVLRFSKVVIGE